MTRTAMLPSTLARLGRETEMLETIVTMMASDRLDGPATRAGSRRDLIVHLADRGLGLAAALLDAVDVTPTASSMAPHRVIAGWPAHGDDADPLPDVRTGPADQPS